MHQWDNSIQIDLGFSEVESESYDIMACFSNKVHGGIELDPKALKSSIETGNPEVSSEWVNVVSDKLLQCKENRLVDSSWKALLSTASSEKRIFCQTSPTKILLYFSELSSITISFQSSGKQSLEIDFCSDNLSHALSLVQTSQTFQQLFKKTSDSPTWNLLNLIEALSTRQEVYNLLKSFQSSWISLQIRQSFVLHARFLPCQKSFWQRFDRA